ncbi:TIGR01777 family protein [candidate division KSB1 bacterium]|nr:TIGR01777 family protein [candidate division KSB1 bacterium]NIR73307.1 TIGR01777 family protein [candidate division KSB1 bacterium]NIS27013.1 TIGR01777 family protein [candidate division KSB1 bacterium]NIT73853.1 TIGR01777 family protein [candidate division KSB1 bacterium]NIU27758.1 TIGR01777 family protein [candidate division KSB1 bacterium]
MNILVSGSTGLIGSDLVAFLTNKGHSIKRLVRSKAAESKDEIYWDIDSETIEAQKLEGLDAVVHLAGENIAGRWTSAKKARIRDSRIKGTRLLRNSLSELERRPKVLVSASAIGYYGDRGDEVLKETSEPGSGFLADVCREWEATTAAATQKGIRVVNLRFGIVLSPKGGALNKMLLPFKIGAGGIVGSGDQYWSWVALDDVIGAIEHAITTESLKGPMNVVAPNPVTNREFTRVIGKVLSRPTILPMPKFAARVALGEMADALLLASARVDSSKLRSSGYEFQFSDLEEALRHLLD